MRPVWLRTKVYRAANVKALAAAERWAGGQGDPIGIIEGGIEAVRNATGLRPNLMTMGASVMSLLKFHPAIQAAIEPTSASVSPSKF